MLGRLVVAGALVVAGVAHGQVALAQTRVVVLGFSGPRGGQARAALVRALEGECALVGLDEWQEAATRLGATGSSSRAYARVAAELNVAAIVAGSVGRARGRRFVLGVAVRSGSSGSIVGRASRTMRTLGSVGGAAAGVATRVLELVAEAETAAPASGASEDEEEEGSEAEEGGEGGEEAGEVMDWSGVGAEAPPGGPGRGGGSVEPGDGQILDAELPGGARRPGASRPTGGGVGGEGGHAPSSGGGSGLLGSGGPGGWLELGIEIPIAERIFTLAINPAIDREARPGARVDSGVFPEIGLRLSFYPLALVDSAAWWAGFGIEGTFHNQIGLVIYRQGEAGQPPLQIEANEYSASALVTYRGVIGTESVGATIMGAVGWGRFSFFMGPVNNDLVPPFDYDYIHLGLSGSVPFGTPYIGLDLSVAYLGVVSIGFEAAATFNASGSLPTSNGYELLAGLSGRIWGGLRYRVAFELLGFVTSHQGVGRGWGTDPTTVIGAAAGAQGIETVAPTDDLFWRLVLGLSYRFGGGAARPRPAAEGAATAGSEAMGEWIEDGPEPEPAEPEEGAAEPEEEEEETTDEDGWMTTD